MILRIGDDVSDFQIPPKAYKYSSSNVHNPIPDLGSLIDGKFVHLSVSMQYISHL